MPSIEELVKIPSEKVKRKSQDSSPVKSKKSKKSKTENCDDVEVKTKKSKKSKKDTQEIQETSSVAPADSDSPSATEITEIKKSKKSKKSKKESDEITEKSSNSPSSEEPKAVETTVIVEEVEIKDEIPINQKFSSHDLSPSTLKSLQDRGCTHLFPIQAASFKPIMDGNDILGRARTGTGKTLAFSLPMVETLKREKRNDPASYSRRGRSPKVIIMAPTRELAIQVHREFDQICSGELKTLCVYGGSAYQSYAIKDGVDVLVGTPGRLIDHIDRGDAKLSGLRFICLDEADQMLDIGFADAMEKVLKSIQDQKAAVEGSPPHQTLLFSATLPSWITQAVKKYMRTDKITLDLIGNDKQKTSTNVKHLSIPSRWQNRASILGDILAVYGRGNCGRSIIFVETKNEGNELGLNDKLVAAGCQVIHGDIPQKQREVSMQGFRDGKFRCLICTNVCARGVDIPEVDLVINCEPPESVDTYVHRSGRTGRAGKSGICVTFFKDQQEYQLNNISKRAGVEFTRICAPQPKDIVTARATSTLDVIKTELDPEVLPYFTATAEAILLHYNNDAVTALSATIALLCNTIKKLPSRSLLSSNEGFVTLLFRVETEIRNVGYIRSMTQKSFPGLTYEDTFGWRMTADNKGVVVDVKEDKVVANEDGTFVIAGSPFKNSWGVTIEIAKELPEMQEKMVMQGDQQRGGRSFGGRGGSFGGRSSGGRGGSFGGRSSGGRGRGGFRR